MVMHGNNNVSSAHLELSSNTGNAPKDAGQIKSISTECACAQKDLLAKVEIA